MFMFMFVVILHRVGEPTLQKPDVAKQILEILAFWPRNDVRSRESVKIAQREETNATAATNVPEIPVNF